MSERWFFALWPDSRARNEMARVAADCVPSKARRVHPLDFHLTLRFLGTLDDDGLFRVQRAADALRWSAVAVRIDRLGCFHRSRVMWCGPAQPGPGLVGLADRLEAGVARAGLPAEPRPFVPHITLARRVDRCPRCVWPAPLEWTAAELVLAFGRQGHVPRYVQHRRWSLAPDRSINPSPGL